MKYYAVYQVLDGDYTMCRLFAGGALAEVPAMFFNVEDAERFAATMRSIKGYEGFVYNVISAYVD